MSDTSPPVAHYLADAIVISWVDDDARVTVDVSTYLVEATSFDEAYAKATRFAEEGATDYVGAETGELVHQKLIGFRSIALIAEPLRDGAEIAWERALEDVSKEEALSLVRRKEDLSGRKS